MTPLTPVPPPTPQEVTRKLSLHSVRPTKLPKGLPGESDSESIVSPPDLVPPSPRTPGPATVLASASATHPLSAIAEAPPHSAEEDSDEEDADGEARYRGRERAGELGETVIKSGYLWKKGERRKTWKKRWFVLRSSHLAYYKTSAEYRLLRLLDLGDVHSCLMVTLKRHDNSFGIVAPTRTFYLQAQDQREARAWVAAINEQCEKVRAASPRASVVAIAPPMVTSPSDVTISAAQPIPIPGRAGAPPPAVGHSPGYGVTSSDSEDASVSPNRQGRTRSYSRSSSAVPPSPTWPTAGAAATATVSAASPTRITGTVAHPDWDPSKVVVNGYLMKCGSKRRHWRKRWFVLTGEKLVYSGSHMDTKPHREIALSQVLDALEYELPAHTRTGAAAPFVSGSHTSGTSHGASTFSPSESADSQPDDGQHAFKIVTTKRTLLLCAPTEEEEINWLSAVRALLARRTAAAGVDNAGAGAGDGGMTPVAQHAQSPSSGGSGGAGSTGLKGKVVRRLSLSTGVGALSLGSPPPAAAVGAGASRDEEEKAR